MKTVRACALLLLPIAALGAAMVANNAGAQSYPAKPVHIHTANPGGGGDIISRLIANELAGPLGQPMVVENRPAGLVLFQGVLKSAPDGYTLMITPGSLWTTPLLGEAPYDAQRDFAPITALTTSPNILMVHASMPGSVAEFIKLAKAKPGVLNYSAGSTGSSSHLAAELFKYMAGVDMVRITYKQQSQETADLTTGQVQMTISNATSLAPLIKAGKLRALATGGARRSLLMPDLPLLSDTLPGFVSESLFAFFAPGKTPDPIVRRVNQETVRVLAKPEVRDRLLQMGQEPAPGTPEQLAEAIRSEMARLGKLIKDVGIKVEG